MSEFAQTTQKKTDYFKVPERQRILKAFPAKCRAAIFDLGCDVDQELFGSVNAKKAETIRTRQAHYLKFCVDHLVPDPCGDGPSYEFLVAV